MKERDATELAFKNGYEKAVREIFAAIDSMCIDTFGNFNHGRFIELKEKYAKGCEGGIRWMKHTTESST